MFRQPVPELPQFMPELRKLVPAYLFPPVKLLNGVAQGSLFAVKRCLCRS